MTEKLIVHELSSEFDEFRMMLRPGTKGKTPIMLNGKIKDSYCCI